MIVQLVASTTGCGVLAGRNAEDVITYAARASTPDHQQRFDTSDRLIAYCIRNQHWSVFETASLTFEITTSRAIADQLVRHRSFTFQMASQRYAPCAARMECTARRQDPKNRQHSVDDLDDDTKDWFSAAQTGLWTAAMDVYSQAIDKGIARECARFVLPLATSTTLYMTGSFRSWFHYCELRAGNGTQAEHADIAKAIMRCICDEYPRIGKAFLWLP